MCSSCECKCEFASVVADIIAALDDAGYQQRDLPPLERVKAAIRLNDALAQTNTKMLEELGETEQKLTSANQELKRWREWDPDDEDLAAMKEQAEGNDSLAAKGVYIGFLEHFLRQAQAENERLREMVIGLECMTRAGKYGCQYVKVMKSPNELLGVAKVEGSCDTTSSLRQYIEPMKIADLKMEVSENVKAE